MLTRSNIRPSRWTGTGILDETSAFELQTRVARTGWIGARNCRRVSLNE